MFNLKRTFIVAALVFLTQSHLVMAQDDLNVAKTPDNGIFKSNEQVLQDIMNCQKDPTSPNCQTGPKSYSIKYAHDKDGNLIKDKDGNFVVESGTVKAGSGPTQALDKNDPTNPFAKDMKANKPDAAPTQSVLPTPAVPQANPTPAPSAATIPVPRAPTVPGAPGAVVPTATGDAPTKSIVNNLPANHSRAKEIVIPVFDKSLMFTPDEINKIRMVYKVYLERQKNKNQENTEKPSGVEDLLGKLNINQSDKDLPAAPSGIYLNSILFRAPENATAWINGKKYEVGTTVNDIKVTKIEASTVEFEWRLAGYKDTDFNDWSALFPDIGDKDAAKKSEDMPASRRGIMVDGQTKVIQVALKPNQYLDTQAKAIKEGHPPKPKPETGAPGDKPSLLDKTLDKLKSPESPVDKTPEQEPKKDDSGDQKKEVKIKASPLGHYDIPASINGQMITFRLDTGATYPVISKDDAKRVGINTDNLQYDFEAKIADGTIIKSAKATIESMNIEELNFKNIDVMVADGNFPQPLLGSSFLNTINTSISNGTLTITK